MPSARTAYVTNQPREDDIHNSFSLMGNERFLRLWIYKEDSCDCTGSYYVTLTDTRLLLRAEDTNCCRCGSEPEHVDSSIFLRDIAEMRESRKGHDFCSRYCGCCRCCCGVPKMMELKGSFGTEILHVAKEDMLTAQMEIPAAIGNHKLVSQY